MKNKISILLTVALIASLAGNVALFVINAQSMMNRDVVGAALEGLHARTQNVQDQYINDLKNPGK